MERFKKGKCGQFEHCPQCGYGLDTGWECTKCKTDWMHFAYPWWKQLIYKLKMVLRGE